MAIFTLSIHSLSEQTPNDKEMYNINKRPMYDQGDDEKAVDFDEVRCQSLFRRQSVPREYRGRK